MSETDTPDTAADSTPVVTDKPLEKQESKVYDEAYVKELRQEAAAARVGKKEAVEAAIKELSEKHAAELAERDTRYTELENELGKAWVELEKLYVTIDAKVPSDKVRQFMSILQGTDAESIKESAKASLDLIGGFDTRTPGFDPTQGFGGRPKDMPLNGDPILEAIKKAVER